MKNIAFHFDFESHKDIRINHAPDTEGMARTLKKYGVEEIITFAKGHDGFAYYPSTVGYPHPRMQGDAFGDVVKACKKKGLRVLAYVSFGIDGEAGRAHRDWVQIPPEDTEIPDDWFVPVCPFTPYLEQSLLPMIAEIHSLYPVDGFFFDTMGALGICHCDSCEKVFQEVHGRQIPRKTDDPAWGIYGQFRHARGMAMLEQVGTFIKNLNPDAKIGFNHIGTFRYPEKVSHAVSCLTLDFPITGHQSRQASFCAAMGSTADLPADVMNTIFNQGWSDWSPRPFPILEQFSVAVWARNCRPYFGSRLHPENRLDPVTVNALRSVAAVAKKVKKAYPADDARLAPDILLLHGPATMYGEDMRSFARDSAGLEPIEGAHHLFLDAGANFSIVMEDFLDRNLSDNPLLVLPEMSAISRTTAETIRAYAERGGRILFVGTIPTVEGTPCDLPGVTQDEKPWQDHIYLPPWSSGEQPVLVRGDFHRLSLSTAEPVLHAIQPYDCRHGIRFVFGGLGPASAEVSPYPALTRRRLGNGEIWYLEANIFTNYREIADWTQIAWTRSLLECLTPRPAARLVSQTGTVELVVHANAASTWLFLVNHGGEQLNGRYGWTRTFMPVPAFPVTLEVRSPSGNTPQRVTRTGRSVKRWSFAGGTVTISLTMDTIWSVIRIDW